MITVRNWTKQNPWGLCVAEHEFSNMRWKSEGNSCQFWVTKPAIIGGAISGFYFVQLESIIFGVTFRNRLFQKRKRGKGRRNEERKDKIQGKQMAGIDCQWNILCVVGPSKINGLSDHSSAKCTDRILVHI